MGKEEGEEEEEENKKWGRQEKCKIWERVVQFILDSGSHTLSTNTSHMNVHAAFSVSAFYVYFFQAVFIYKVLQRHQVLTSVGQVLTWLF